MDVKKMETLQIRLTKNMLDRIDVLIKQGTYPNRSEAVRDSVRKMLDRKPATSEVLTVSVKDLQKFIKTTGRQ
jgi:Arc/MetJ-type ribon-helix-helix transcriptional regulator